MTGQHPSIMQHRSAARAGGFASLITFDGGTGQMSGASGQIRLRGEFSASEGTTSGDYLGELCKAQT